MFDQIVATLQAYPYVGAAVVLVLCGIGLPLPEEIVLLASGYICANAPDVARLPVMMAWCGAAILVGDLIPCVLGRVFGVRLLRLRWLRHLVTKQRLATFDGWFRKRGDLVILIARFLPGIRVVAFFTAGTMKMPWQRFLLLDGLGIALIVPLLTWVGFHSAGFIDRVVAFVEKAERGILWGTVAAVVVAGVWFWLWRRKHRKPRRERPGEAYVQPQRPVQEPPLFGPYMPESVATPLTNDSAATTTTTATTTALPAPPAPPTDSTNAPPPTA